MGNEIYEKLIKGYTEKQWGRDCKALPVCIMKRIPIRFVYDNNYFSEPFQGIPKGGYTSIIEKMLSKADVILNTNYITDREKFKKYAKKIIYTGPIDEYYGSKYGALQYRSLRFETEILDEENAQGVAVVNYTDKETPFTRSIEHKHFEFGTQPYTVITKEYPLEWKPGIEAYYPINDSVNNQRYAAYQKEAQKEKDLYFAGRLGAYMYTDMQDTVKSALKLWDKISEENR